MKAYTSALIIDDDSISNFLLESHLQKAALCRSITKVKNGAEGIEFIRKHLDNPPDLIFLDWNMPVMSGDDFLDEIKRLFPAILTQSRIISISNLLRPEDEKKLESFNISYLPKPISKNYLMEVLASPAGI